nr:exodeoxyribonuclease V subunit beta [uncultured Haemophilus sp.]
MSQKSTALNAISLPLNQVNLIEASAGTGKTYTIGSIYLRLLLQAGENCFSRPLNVEEILVVTFTEMATEDLKRKIRERLTAAISVFSEYYETKDKAIFTGEHQFLAELLPYLEDIPTALRRLKLAEQNLDLASIYTIHGFCRRMLMQHAFNSGVHFNLKLLKEQSDLLRQFANEFWREHFYSQSFEIANFISKELGSPDDVLSILESDLNKDVSVATDNQQSLSLSIDEFLQKSVGDRLKAVEALKVFWLKNVDEISSIIMEEITKDYPKDQLKSLNRKIYQKGRLKTWTKQINEWANNPLDYEINKTLRDYFLQSSIEQNYEPTEELNNKKAAMPFYAPIFAELEEYVQILVKQHQSSDLLKKIILYHYRQGIQKKLLEYKANHPEKSFDDLLRLLKEALYGEGGEQLAELIRFQYPFAMIDEFQDTDALQYQIFSKIYRNETASGNVGFMMIGDPKQAIYRFRGADIFTYLKAAKEANERFNLGTNYRSSQPLVEGVNRLFDFKNSPFIYENIEFLNVGAAKKNLVFQLNNQPEPAFRFYINDKDKSTQQDYAKTCATSIQQWLKSAAENPVVFPNESKAENQILRAENIAVLVRGYTEADLVKKELQALGIASVYLSDRGNVFESNTAKELALILQACLSVTERPILNAIATSLFGLNAAEIHQIHHDEIQWQRWAEKFAEYQQIWQRQGVLPMLHHLLLAENITEKLLSRPDGERKLTDLLHLAEILQQAAALNESEAALLRWFEKQIQDNGRQEAQIRLESERQLVKIVTIHKSKGLEYDLVWLPFLGNEAKDPTKSGNQKKLFNLYYDSDEDKTLWDMQDQHSDELTEEVFAEELRLLYVALTRAKYQMAFVLPKAFDKKWNALLYVLTQGEIGRKLNLPNNWDTQPLLKKFKQRLPNDVAIELTDVLQASEPLTLNVSQDNLSAEIFQGEIEQDWRVTSFSGIEQTHQRKAYLNESAVKKSLIFDDAKDYDASISTENITENLAALAHDNDEMVLDFPRGTQIGTLLHRYFEKVPFAQLAEKENIEKLCQDLNLSEEQFAAVQQWFEQILSTPILPNHDLTLAQINEKQCLKELAFYLNITSHFDVAGFNRALATLHHLPSEPLQFDDIQGMVRGTMDLVFCHQGKYYLLDYKSNFLGEALKDYDQAALKKAMLEHHYDWQYLLYVVALHRYLKTRLPDYDYNRDFGGVVYAFLRGMNGSPQSGLFFDKPDWQLIQQLEELF